MQRYVAGVVRNANIGSKSLTTAPINAGSIRGLAIESPERVPLVNSVPTYAENGFPNYFASSWIGFFVPAQTPDAVLAKLNASIGKVLNDRFVRERLDPFGVRFIHAPLPQTSEFFKSEVNRWGEMVRALDLSVD